MDVSAFLNNDVVDAIGAGDSFNSGFINSFIKGKRMKECLEDGAITGAINTTASGGTAAFESKEKVKQLAETKFNYKLDI
jgi:sugar/nucleoside kinase (ribokinase family)